MRTPPPPITPDDRDALAIATLVELLVLALMGGTLLYRYL